MTETALVLAKCMRVRLPGDVCGRARFDFAVRRAYSRLEPHHHEYDAQRLCSRRVMAQVLCGNT